MFCPRINDDQFSSTIRFINPRSSNAWDSMYLETTPTAIVGVERDFFVRINDGELQQVDIHNYRTLVTVGLSIPGPLATISTNSSFSYVQDIAGVLFVLVNSSNDRYCFCNVRPVFLGSGSHYSTTPIDLYTGTCLVISNDLDRIARRRKSAWINVQNFDSSSLIGKLSQYWIHDDVVSCKYRPVGWISNVSL